MRNLFLVILSSVLLIGAWPTYGFAPLLFVGFVPILWLNKYANIKVWQKHVWIALAFMLFNLATCWWIINAHWVGMVSAVLLNTLMMTSVFIVYNKFARFLKPSNGYLLLITLWVSMEFLMYRWDLLWPWMTLGNGFSEFINLVQWYEFTGILGGSLWVLLVNVSFFRLLEKVQGDWRTMAFIRKGIIRVMVLIGIPTAISLGLIPNVSDLETEIDAVVVQPNIDPYTEKFNGSDHLQMKHFFALAASKMDSNVNIIVGPETVYPSGIWENGLDKNSIPLLSSFLYQFPQSSVLLGATTYRFYNSEDSRSNTSRPLNGRGYYDVFNTSLFFEVQNQVQFSQKGKLVPGAEMMPFSNLLSPLKKAMLDFGGTSGSLGMPDSIKVFEAKDGFVIASAICYESVCGEYLAKMVAKGANVIAIITNDGWWGDTEGHRQHRSYASLRAIENRRSILRSANTGESVFIDVSGQVMDKISWDNSGAIRSKVKLNDYLTFYTMHGDYLGRLASFLAIALMLFALVKSRSEKNHS